VVEEVDLDGVIVLAYKVRRVPLAPNPDLTLPWRDEEAAAPTTPASTTTPTTPTTSTTPSVPTTRSSTPFPLPAGHCLGAKASAKVHNGTASAADGKAARQLQARLRDLGAAIGVDGHLGKQSDAAIRAFQKKRGLAADGLVGPATWRALFS
jgi:peptidoglycan hydrolase-like protein with peptidoglycan-binding domain